MASLALPLLQEGALLVEENAIPIAKAVGGAVATWGAEKLREKYNAYRQSRKRSRQEAERTDRIRLVPDPNVRLHDRERMAAYVKPFRKRRRRGSRKTRRTRRSRRSTRRVRSTRSRRSRRSAQVNGQRVGVRWGLYYAGYDYNSSHITATYNGYSMAASLGGSRNNTSYWSLRAGFQNFGFLPSNTTVSEQTCGYLWKGFKVLCPIRYPPIGRIKVTVRVCLYNARTFNNLGTTFSERLESVHGEEGIRTMAQIPFRARPQKEAYLLLAKKTYTLKANNSEGGTINVGADGIQVSGYGMHPYLVNGTIVCKKTFRRPLYIRQYYTGTGNNNPGLAIGDGSATTWTIGKTKTPVIIVLFMSYQQVDRLVPLNGTTVALADNFEMAHCMFSWLHVDRVDAYRIADPALGGVAAADQPAQPSDMAIEPHRELIEEYSGSEASEADPYQSSAIPSWAIPDGHDVL